MLLAANYITPKTAAPLFHFTQENQTTNDATGHKKYCYAVTILPWSAKRFDVLQLCSLILFPADICRRMSVGVVLL